MLFRSRIGRAPSGDGALVRFPDPDRLISKNHLAYRVEQDGLSVIDLHSGNGTQIHRDGAITDCTPGTSYLVRPNDLVQLGDQHFTLR